MTLKHKFKRYELRKTVRLTSFKVLKSTNFFFNLVSVSIVIITTLIYQ